MAKILVRYLKQGNKSYRIMLLNNITNTVHKKKKKRRKYFQRLKKIGSKQRHFFIGNNFQFLSFFLLSPHSENKMKIIFLKMSNNLQFLYILPFFCLFILFNYKFINEIYAFITKIRIK